MGNQEVVALRLLLESTNFIKYVNHLLIARFVDKTDVSQHIQKLVAHIFHSLQC